jgi:prenyltransferase beta subunit
MSASPRVIKWLLEKENPSVRYFTLRDILGKSQTDADVTEAKASISSYGVVARIFSKQKTEGFWEERHKPYIPKYKATYWQIMILAQLGIDKANPRAEQACEFVLGQQLDEGGFSSHTIRAALEEYDWMRSKIALKEKPAPDADSWARSRVTEYEMSCLTGNVCASLLRMGYDSDARVLKALNWLVKVQNQDGGWLCPYWKAHIKDKHGCFYGTICPLEALSEIPEKMQTAEMKKAIERAAEFLLMHHLFKADQHGYKVINQNWLKLSFPWFYGYNILRGLAVLTKLGYVDDERLIDAVELLLKKRCPDGTWLLENAPTGRMHANIEIIGKPSKWITLNALKVLKRLDRTKNDKLRRVMKKART